MAVMDSNAAVVIPIRQTKTAERKAKRLAAEAKIREQEAARQRRKRASAFGTVACSRPWFEAVVHRNEPYSPDFQCQCDRCRSETPSRLDPRPARETKISIDCQEDAEMEDAEFFPKFAQVDRIGSVYVTNRVQEYDA